MMSRDYYLKWIDDSIGNEDASVGKFKYLRSDKIAMEEGHLPKMTEPKKPAIRKERKTPNVNTTTTQVFHIEKDGFDVIFNNVTLVDLATRQPRTREELLSISGIGEKKVELYGNEIVRIIQGHNK